MKILFLAPYIYDGIHPEFSRNKTGFGLYVPQIAQAVGQHHQVLMETFMPTKGFVCKSEIGSFQVLKKTPLQIALRAFPEGYFRALVTFFKEKGSLKNRIHNAYYQLNVGSARAAIRKTKPDLVHVQNVSSVFIRACEKEGVPYVVTLHGLNGLRSDIVPNLYREKEEQFSREALEKKISVSVIATGMKERIEKHYLDGKSADNITVIPNGTGMKPLLTEEPKEKIITAVGSLTVLKNQEAIIEAVRLLGDRLNGYQVHLCGVDHMNGKLQKLVKEYGLEDRVLFRGFLPPERVQELLCRSTLNILASHDDEGFGISIVEAFMCGTPCLIFSDICAVKDVYDESSVPLCRERSTQALADTIEQALKRNWDRNAIREHGKKFSMESIGSRYIRFYEAALSSKKGSMKHD